MHIRSKQEDRVRATRIMANLRVADIETAKSFYTDYLGLSTEEFNMGWVARYTSPDTETNVQLVTRDATAPEDSIISVHTDDVDGAYEEASETRLRDRATDNDRALGGAPVLRPSTGRQCDQHCAPSRLTGPCRAVSGRRRTLGYQQTTRRVCRCGRCSDVLLCNIP